MYSNFTYRTLVLANLLRAQGFLRYAQELEDVFNPEWPKQGVELLDDNAPWTLEDDEKLINEILQGATIQLLVFKLRRSRPVIRSRIDKINKELEGYSSVEEYLDVRRQQNTQALTQEPWTLEEDEALIEGILGGTPIPELVQMVNRSETAILRRIGVLNVLLDHYDSVEELLEARRAGKYQ